MALGAERARVTAMIMRGSLIQAILGLMVGVPIAWLCVRFVESQLYEVKGIEIIGFPIVAESTEKFLKTAYSVLWEEMKFVFLGHLSAPIDAALMEEFSDPDILILPVGGGHFLEPEVAAKIVKQLEARIVIPSFYKKPDDFLKALGKKADPAEKLVFKKKDIAGDKGRPVVLHES